MKLCWYNIENVRLSENGNFRDVKKGNTYNLKVCKQCKEEYLGRKNSNFCSKSCSNSYRRFSDETKKKMSEAKKGKKASKETKLLLSEQRKGEKNAMYGKKHTEESKKKMSETLKGKRLGEKNPFFGKKHSEETKKKIGDILKEKMSGKGNPMYGKKHSEETRKKMSDAQKGSKCHFWKGGYSKRGIPTYDTCVHQLEWCEEVRRNKEDPKILEVKCFKCNNWYVPTLSSVNNRIQHLKGNVKVEHKFYCSDECKNSCSIYGKSPEQLEKQDAVRAGRLPWLELTREVQPQLRKMVLERDEHKCVKCNNSNNLQCHHIYPVSTNPLESADVDNCMTLCKECHKKIHQKVDGCGYGQLRRC